MPIPTDITIESSFEVVDPVDVAPPGSNFEAYVETGTTQLTLGDQVHTVTFNTEKAALSYVFDELVIYNEVDATPIVLGYIETAKSTTGFELTTTATPDTGNYYVRWKVRIPTTIVEGAVVATPSTGAVTEVTAVGNDGINATVSNPTTAPTINLSLQDASITAAKLAFTPVTGDVLTPTGAQTVTNKLIDGNNNTLQNIAITAISGAGIITQGMTDPNSDQPVYWDDTAGNFAFRGSPATRGISKEIWLSTRSDGKGTGTADDPFGVGTQATFDALMDSLQGSTYVTFHFPKNATLKTSPVHTWYIKSGWHWIGNGSTLQLDGSISINGQAGLNVAGTDQSVATDYVTIDDITFDANFPALSVTADVGAGSHSVSITTNSTTTISFAANAITSKDRYRVLSGHSKIPAGAYVISITDTTHAVISIQATGATTESTTVAGEFNTVLAALNICGNHNRLNRVISTNTHGSAANSLECFAIRMAASQAADAYDNIAEDCLALNPFGNNSGPFALHGSVGGTYKLHSSKIVRPRAYGVNNKLNEGFTLSGVNVADIQDCELTGAHFEDVGSLWYHDTGTEVGSLVHHNKAIRTSYGIATYVNAKSGLVYANNELYVQNRLIGGSVYGILVNGTTSNSYVASNHLFYDNSGLGTDSFVPFALDSLTGGAILENRSDIGAGAQFTNSTSVDAIGNRTHSGGVLTGLEDSNSTTASITAVQTNSGDDIWHQFTISDTNTYDNSPKSGITFRGKYNVGGDIAGLGGIYAGKENGTNGNYAGFLALLTRPNGSAAVVRLLIDSSGNIQIPSLSASQFVKTDSSKNLVSTTNVAELTANTFTGHQTLSDVNIVLGTGAGTQLGTATGQKLGFWGHAPVAQQILATGAGHSADDVITALQGIGLFKQS